MHKYIWNETLAQIEFLYFNISMKNLEFNKEKEKDWQYFAEIYDYIKHLLPIFDIEFN